jgi:two-component system, chemotaxis family, CheB/CheR fusion protein
MISIDDDPQPNLDPQANKINQTQIERENSQLKQELATTRAALEAIIEQQEFTNHALQIANEEVLASNEELQNTNQALETFQEELRASNEELQIINGELNHRNLELGYINNDLQNLLSSINIPILILDGELRIRRFTSLARSIFNLIPADFGRPFSDIQPNISIPNLEALIITTIDTLTTIEQEVQDRTGYWYRLIIQPYRTINNRIDGVVIRLIDIDSLKQNATLIAAARDCAEMSEHQCKISLAEKEMLLREIHHRVKNNLQIVSSLLNLQSNRSSDLQVIAILQDSQSRIRAMALIHEILYQSSNLAALNFCNYIQTLTNNLVASHNIDRSKITLRIEIEPDVTIDIDRAVLCGLMISELVTNAFKHGFVSDQHGEIAIGLTTSNDNLLTLSVANNGQALPLGFDIYQVRSMGLNLVMSLAKQIKGNVQVETGNITSFKLIFPLFS